MKFLLGFLLGFFAGLLTLVSAVCGFIVGIVASGSLSSDDTPDNQEEAPVS